ncbi:hypothetical protein TNCV_1324201 [Trichonephila clavipes]|nr:hypothetical protein TNCV_1324201 [Trichonephila clavipes]
MKRQNAYLNSNKLEQLVNQHAEIEKVWVRILKKVWVFSKSRLPSRHGDTLVRGASNRQSSREVGGRDRYVRGLYHLQGVRPQDWDATKPNRCTICMVLNDTANDRRTYHEEFRWPLSKTIRLLVLVTT